MLNRAVATVCLIAGLAPLPAPAASSAWHEMQGGRIRLVTIGEPDAAGLLKGALQIELKPGWKTYWRDPGDSGVPPSIDVSRSAGLRGAELAFPAPARHSDGSSEWVGYNRSVAFPVSFAAAERDRVGIIDADVFLGVCETICVPVNAKFSFDPGDGAGDAADAAEVAAAQAALPAPARPDFGLRVAEFTPSQLVIDAAFPGDPASAELYIAGEQGFVLGRPERQPGGGATRFTVAILDRPGEVPDKGGLPYTLVTDQGAVSGLIPFR